MLPKISLPKLGSLKYNFSPLLRNQFVLYAFFAMTLIQILYFVNGGDIAALITMGLIGFLVSFFSKNMIVILCITLTLSSILKYGIKQNTHEGLENKDTVNENGPDEAEVVGEVGDEKVGDEKVGDEKVEDEKVGDKKVGDEKVGDKKVIEEDTKKKPKKSDDDTVRPYDINEDKQFKAVQEKILEGIAAMEPLLIQAEKYMAKQNGGSNK